MVGHILLIDDTDDVTAADDERAVTAADGQRHNKQQPQSVAAVDESAECGTEDEEEEADDRRLATTTAMRLVLRVISVIWPGSLPVAHTLAMLVNAAVHVDKRTREASRRILADMCRRDEHEADKRVQRGAVVQCVVSRVNQLPNAYASSHSRHRVLSELMLLLNQLLHAWLAHSTFGSQQLEGLILHEVEAAVGIWLAAVHPLLRLACVAVLLTLRALAHQLLGHKQHDKRSTRPHMSAIEARDASLQQLASMPSPTRHFIADSFTACSCSPTAPSLLLDSLLPNQHCLGAMGGAVLLQSQPALCAIDEQSGAEDDNKLEDYPSSGGLDEEKDAVQRPLEDIRDALHHRQQGQQPQSPNSAPSVLSSLSQLEPAPAVLSLDEADSVDDGDSYLQHKAIHAARVQSLSSLISRTSEWRWSLLLAHWMRAIVSTATDVTSALPSDAAGSVAPSDHLLSVLSTLLALTESRLLPFHAVHSSLCKRLKGRPPSSELSVLSEAGLPSSRLAVVKNWCLMAAAAHSTTSLPLVAASQSYIALQLLPLLSSPFSVVRRIGSVSVGNIHQSLTGPLLQLLQPLERSVSTSRDDTLRVHLSHVYRLLAESHGGGVGSAGGSPSPFVSRCQGWVVSTFQWLAITGNEFQVGSAGAQTPLLRGGGAAGGHYTASCRPAAAAAPALGRVAATPAVLPSARLVRPRPVVTVVQQQGGQARE